MNADVTQLRVPLTNGRIKSWFMTDYGLFFFFSILFILPMKLGRCWIARKLDETAHCPKAALLTLHFIWSHQDVINALLRRYSTEFTFHKPFSIYSLSVIIHWRNNTWIDQVSCNQLFIILFFYYYNSVKLIIIKFNH